MAQDIVGFYVDSWTQGDRGAVRRLIAPDAVVEWNLDAPVDDEELVQTQHRVATTASAVRLVTRVSAGGRAVLVYDCVAVFGTARLAEFLTVGTGRIVELRQAWDTRAFGRYFPAPPPG